MYTHSTWNTCNEYEWKQSAKGNFVCIKDDEHVATVFRNKWGTWQIILSGTPGKLVLDEGFETADAGQARAEEILDGAECITLARERRRH